MVVNDGQGFVHKPNSDGIKPIPHFELLVNVGERFIETATRKKTSAPDGAVDAKPGAPARAVIDSALVSLLNESVGGSFISVAPLTQELLHARMRWSRINMVDGSDDSDGTSGFFSFVMLFMPRNPVGRHGHVVVEKQYHLPLCLMCASVARGRQPLVRRQENPFQWELCRIAFAQRLSPRILPVAYHDDLKIGRDLKGE